MCQDIPLATAHLPVELCSKICSRLAGEKRDLLNLAMSCKHWSSSALDKLWECLHDIGPLIRLAELHAIGTSQADTEERRQHAERETPMNWSRFDEYARRITFLSHVHREGSNMIDDYDSVIRIFLPHKRTVLPRLRTLKWIHVPSAPRTDSRLSSVLSVFISPSLCDLYIDLNGLESMDTTSQWHEVTDPIMYLRDDAFGEWLAELPINAPNLQHLSLGHALPKFSLDFIGRLTSLRSLDLGDLWMPLDGLEMGQLCKDISSLPRLERLEGMANAWGESYDVQLQDGWSGFPSLECMKLGSVDLPTAEELLRRTTSDNLEYFHFYSILEVPRVSGMYTICEVLATFSITLTEVSLQMQDLSDGESSTKIKILDTFRPLLACSNLEVFEISFEHFIQAPRPDYILTDIDISHMVSAWPRLKYLILNVPVVPSGITFQSLVEFATKSPAVRWLHLPCLAVPNELDWSTIPTTSHLLERLQIKVLEYVDADVVAQVIDRLFPHLDITAMITNEEDLPEDVICALAWIIAQRRHLNREA